MKQRRKFNLTFEQLYQKSMLISGLLQRDLEDFAEFGITQNMLNNFAAQINDFRMIDYDLQQLHSQKQATFNKKKWAEDLKKLLKNLKTKTDMAYHFGVLEYRPFDFVGLSSCSLEKLREVAQNYWQILTSENKKLEAFELAESDLKNLENTIKEYDNATNRQSKAKIERKLTSAARTFKANSLYDELIKFSTLGRRIWALTDPAKAETYVIYATKKRK